MARRKRKLQEIALGRLFILFTEAANQFDEHPRRAHRYMEIARNVAMKVNLSFPTTLKRRMCQDCGHYLAYGKNATVRLDSEQKVKTIRCHDCDHIMRIPYARN